MANVRFSNYASTVLSAPLVASTTIMVVATTTAFPVLTAGDWFYATLIDQPSYSTQAIPPAQREIVKVTAIAGNNLTVVRGQDGTAAQIWAQGAIVELRVNAQSLADIALQTSGTYTAPFAGAVPRTIVSKLSDVFSIADFGAVGDGAANDEPALTAAMTALIANGGGTLQFGFHKTYKVVPTTLAGNLYFCSGLSALGIQGNGSTINIAQTYTGTQYTYIWAVVGCTNILVQNLIMTGFVEDASVSGAANRNFRTFSIQNSSQISFTNFTQTGGVYGINFSGIIGGGAATECYDIDLRNIACTSTYYPVSFSPQGGRNIYVQLDTASVGRSIIAYGIRNAKLIVNSVDAYADDILLYGPRDANYPFVTGAENVEINYRSYGRTRASNGQAVTIICSTDGSGAAFLRNIKVNFDMDWGNGAGFQNNPLIIARFLNGVADVGGAKGHLVDNLSFSGFINNVKTAYNIFACFQGWPAGEIVRNVNVSNLVVTTGNASAATLQFDRTPLVGALSFDNVYIQAPGDLSLNGTANGTVSYKSVTTNTLTNQDAATSLALAGMTTTQRNAIASPPGGLVIFNSTSSTLDFYNGASWKQIAGA